MTTTEQNILETLIELENTVKSMSTAKPKPSLQRLFARLDALTNALPKDTDPNLLHYLHKKSYEKARLALEGRDAENRRGKCH
jgi:hypothetical protein